MSRRPDFVAAAIAAALILAGLRIAHAAPDIFPGRPDA